MITTFVKSTADVERVANVSLVRDVLIEPIQLARLGSLEWSAVTDLAKYAHQQSLNPILVWDTLMTQAEFRKIAASLRALDFQLFSAIRVADLGAAHWVIQNTDRNIELICEAGSHNVDALRVWCDIFKDRLVRLIVSHEIPENDLAELCRQVPCRIEILGAGRIEMFYSPRPLLSKNFELGPEGRKEVTVSSPDSHNRPFPVVETVHGTMMYLHRDRFILDRWKKFMDMGVASLRVDLRHLSAAGHAAEGIEAVVHAIEDLQVPHWPHATSAPFRQANNTLRSSARIRERLDRVRSSACIAQVIASESERYTVFQVVRASEIRNGLQVIIPTGEELVLPTTNFRDSKNMPVLSFVPGQILVTPWIRKLVPGSVLMAPGVRSVIEDC
jgi:putative protease